MSSNELIKNLLASLREELVQDVLSTIRKELSTIPKPDDKAQWLSQKEVAKLLDISVQTLIAWVKKGKLDAYRMGRKVRFKTADIDAKFKMIKIK